MEQLHVEGEAIERRRLEEWACHIRAECLESALSVSVLTKQQGVGGEVDQTATDLAQTARTDQRGGISVAPTSHYDVVPLLHLVHQRCGLGGAVSQICIGEHHSATVRRSHPSSHGGPLTPVPIETYHTIGTSSLGGRGGVVRRPVINHHHFDVGTQCST